jgi:hypothetical protein
MISDRGSRREEYVQYVGIVDAELEMQRAKGPFSRTFFLTGIGHEEPGYCIKHKAVWYKIHKEPPRTGP